MMKPTISDAGGEKSTQDRRTTDLFGRMQALTRRR